MDLFFLAIYLGNLLNYIDRGLISTLLPKFQDEFNLTKLEQGVLSSSFMIGYAIFSFIFSILASRYNKRTLLILGSMLWCVSCLFMSVSTQKWSLYLARAISGIGEASYQSIVPVFLTDTYGEERGWRKTSIFFTAINIGFSIGILLGGVIVHWRIIYLVELVMGLIFVCLIYYTEPVNAVELREVLDKPESNELEKIKTIFKNPEWWYGTLGNMFVAYANGVLCLWIPTYYKDNYSQEISYHTLSGILAVTLLTAGTIGSIFGDKLSKYMAGRDFSNRSELFRICFLAVLCCIPFAFFSVAFNESLILSISLLFAALICFSFISIPNGMISVTCVDSECRSYSTSLCILVLHMGGDMPSPIISSLIWDKTHDLRQAICYSLISLFFSVTIYFIGYRKSWRKYQINELNANLIENIEINS